MNGISIYTLPCVKQRACGKLLYSTGSSARGSVMPLRGGIRGCGGREAQEGRALCVHEADSPCYSAETDYRTITLISHASKVMLKFSKPGFSNM